MDDKTSDFCVAILQFVDYWDNYPEKTKKESLQGLAFSILRLLDGLGPNFDGDINTLARDNTKKLFHHSLREKQKERYGR